MSKAKTVFVCQSCGHTGTKWLGRCPDCEAWNTFVEEVQVPQRGARQPLGAQTQLPLPLTEVARSGEERLLTGIDELDRVLGGGVVSGSLVLVGGDPGIGKCVTADTRILDPTSGAYLPITEWATERRGVLAVDEQTLQLAPAPVVALHEQGTRAIVEVKTTLGRTLRCTSDHPLLTPTGWQPVGALCPGSRIASPRALPYFGQDALPEAMVKLIAYILSDGSAQSAIGVTSDLPEVAQDLQEIAAAFQMQLVSYAKVGTNAMQYRFVNDVEQRAAVRQELATALLTVKTRLGISWASWARHANVSYGLLHAWRRGECVPSEASLRQLADAVKVPLKNLAAEARSRVEAKTPIARFLEEVGLRFSRAASKAVPSCIFRLPRAQLALFLKVLFTCDGSVYVNRRGQPGISYSTISPRLAQDVQHLLLRFGLVATLRTKLSHMCNTSYTAYEVTLLGIAEVQRFLATIGIMGRKAACEQIANMELPQLPSTHRDTVPLSEWFWEYLRTASDNGSFIEISRRAGVTIRPRRYQRPLCRSTITKLANGFPDPRLQALGHGDVYWDEVLSITPAGEAPVYDLSVPRRANFVANDLIIHNSTLLLQAAAGLSQQLAHDPAGNLVLYVSGEESASQLRIRSDRLGANCPQVYILTATSLELIREQVTRLRPRVLVIDSIQTVFTADITSAPGSVSQVRESTAQLMALAKPLNLPVFLIGHVTKEGTIAGPRVLEHIVDTVLYFEGERHHIYRMLRAVKNRFGPTNEIGVFEMQQTGLAEVGNPSELFLAERPLHASGSVVVASMEGTRPLLVELQALGSPSGFGAPRRVANGVDYQRLVLLLAVLEKRLGLPMQAHDVYVNVVGGLRLEEPAIDLAMVVAVASSLQEVSLDPQLVVCGEVGLTGEVRAVTQVETRLREAGKLGFRRCILPQANCQSSLAIAGVELCGVRTVAEALQMLQTPSPVAGKAAATSSGQQPARAQRAPTYAER
jgi:DNA repair protein RadA/Sms